MKIDNIEIKKYAALAPMAGVGDRAFREICIEQGATFVVGEMCSAKGITYGSDKSCELLEMGENEKPCAVQLFSDEPEVMAQAIRLIQKYKPQIIDINMGCPAPKITGGGAGSALMRNLPLAKEIIERAVSAADTPITVKFRKGWDNSSVNAVELAQIAQNSGAKSVCIHGRTKAQMYGFPIDLDIIKEVKDAVSIPVIGNGGIRSAQDALDMYEKTGCDLVIVGEGALGRPWIFSEIAAAINNRPIPQEPTVEQRMDILRRQVEKAVLYKNEKVALREARTHAGWYMKGLKGASSLRRAAGSLNTLADLYDFINLVIKTVHEHEDN